MLYPLDDPPSRYSDPVDPNWPEVLEPEVAGLGFGGFLDNVPESQTKYFTHSSTYKPSLQQTRAHVRNMVTPPEKSQHAPNFGCHLPPWKAKVLVVLFWTICCWNFLTHIHHPKALSPDLPEHFGPILGIKRCVCLRCTFFAASRQISVCLHVCFNSLLWNKSRLDKTTVYTVYIGCFYLQMNPGIHCCCSGSRMESDWTWQWLWNWICTAETTRSFLQQSMRIFTSLMSATFYIWCRVFQPLRGPKRKVFSAWALIFCDLALLPFNMLFASFIWTTFGFRNETSSWE